MNAEYKTEAVTEMPPPSSIGDADNRWVVVHRSLFPPPHSSSNKREGGGVRACALYRQLGGNRLNSIDL